MNRTDKILVFVYTVITVIFIAASLDGEFLVNFCREDGPVEWSQAIFLLAASIIFLIKFIKERKTGNAFNIINLVLSLFCLFVFLEEISYGQRIFGFTTPYYFNRNNAHREINIHNLMTFDSSSEMAVSLIYLIWGIILPFVLLINKKWRAFTQERYFYIPPLYAALFCIAGLVIEIFCRVKYPAYWANNNEITELYLYFTFLVIISRSNATA